MTVRTNPGPQSDTASYLNQGLRHCMSKSGLLQLGNTCTCALHYFISLFPHIQTNMFLCFVFLQYVAFALTNLAIILLHLQVFLHHEVFLHLKCFIIMKFFFIIKCFFNLCFFKLNFFNLCFLNSFFNKVFLLFIRFFLFSWFHVYYQWS